MRIEDFMTRRVVTVTPDTSILAAAKLMLENHISGLPVVDASAHVVGIISESDLLRDDGKGVDGSPWLQMMVGARRACPASRHSSAREKSASHDARAGHRCARTHRSRTPAA